MNQISQPTSAALPAFPLDQWYVAGFAWELKDQPVARTLLSLPHRREPMDVCSVEPLPG